MKKLLAMAFFSLVAARACAVDGVFVEYGRGNNVQMARAGALWKWDRTWWNDSDWRISGFWEAAVGRWRGSKPNDNNQTITEVALTPVFRVAPKEGEGVMPYVEGGFLGLHFISPTFIYSGRKFGSAFQFGHHVGFGVSFGGRRQFDLGYRFQHISNGDIKLPNQGINFSELHFVYRF